MAAIAFYNGTTTHIALGELERTIMVNQKFTRREFVGGSLAASLLAGVLDESQAQGEATGGAEYRLFWGDLHNHNAIGYAKGSLERSYDIARNHLDFFCFTGHSQWHDMPTMPQNKHLKWVRGFEVMKNNWEKVKRFANEYYAPGKFVSFIGYEWHSSSCGDVCIVFPSSKAELVYLNSIEEFQEFARGHGATLIPHHPSYKQGWRGQNWGVLDPTVSPVVEIFSEHGNAESDRGPHRYIRHSMGGRYTQNTLQWLWRQGAQVGVVASTDDHLGYPGAYGEGLVATYVKTLTRESIMEALKARRTYGVSADRIELDFRLNGRWMGETIPATAARNIHVKAKGKDVIDRVEVLRNNEVIHRDHPIDRTIGASSWKQPILCRIEFGWGPWGDLNMARICDWQFRIVVNGGRILCATPCFQSGPFDEERRNRISTLNDRSFEVVSYTSRMQAYEERATNAIILAVQGTPKTELKIAVIRPTKMTIAKSLGEIAESSDAEFTGPFTSESILLHRIVFSENYSTEFKLIDKRQTGRTDWYYVRVVQSNGSLAWSSPIWLKSSS